MSSNRRGKHGDQIKSGVARVLLLRERITNIRLEGDEEMGSQNSFYLTSALLLVGGALVGCNGSSSGSANSVSPKGSPVSAPVVSHDNEISNAPSAPADAYPVSLSGNVTLTSYTNEDGTPMTDDQMAALRAQFPQLGANYDQLASAVSAEESSGIVTLYDANGNVILVIPAAGYQDVRSVVATAGAADDRGKCSSGGTLLFDLNDTTEVADQRQDKDQDKGQGQVVVDKDKDKGQHQGRDKDKDRGKGKDRPAVQTGGLHVLLTFACEEKKQEQMQEPKHGPMHQDPKHEEPKHQEPKHQEPKTPNPAPQN